MKKYFKSIIFIFSFLGFSGCLNLDGFLFNSKLQENYALPGNTIADSLIVPVTFSSEGYTLYGFWVKSEGAGLTILYCHGNKYSMDEYWDRVMLLHKTGANVFIFDYRGYGQSQGESSEKSLYADGLAAYQYIKTNYHVIDDSLCIYGYSLGNVVSIYLSSLDSVKPLCLIAEAPFASANSLTQAGISLNLPAYWMTEGNFDNAERIKQIHSPFLLFHGEADDFVRYKDNGKIVYENAPQPKKLILVPLASHTDIPFIMGENAYLDSVKTWISSRKLVP